MQSRSPSNDGVDEVVLEQVHLALQPMVQLPPDLLSSRTAGWKEKHESGSDDTSLKAKDKPRRGFLSQSQAITNERVILNVGGQVHETFLATLNRLPETRLAKLAQDFKSDQAYDKRTGQFFFNRNPTIFTSILQYYRTGELHIDHNICGNAIKNELDFWLIDANDIEPCCWAQYAKFLENKETLKMLDDSFAVYEDVFAEPEGEVGWKKLQRRVWRHMEDPSYSLLAKVFTCLSIFFVVLSILAYVLETHSYFRVLRPDYYPKNDTLSDDNGSNYTYSEPSTTETPCSCNNTQPANGIIELTDYNSYAVWWLSCITFTCFAWFIAEFILRLVFCPNLREFFSSTLNILDLVVLLAMTVESLAIILVDDIPRNNALKILIPLRFARIVRIMKLMKHYRAFKVLVYTIKVSLKELALMIIFLMIGVVIFACLVYYAEPDNFDSIPVGCWWALVTMTTVGYGDYRPTQVGGYIIGCVAAICGVLMIAFTVPIVVNNFTLYYSHAQSRAKMRPKRRATKLLNKLAALTMFVPTIDEIKEVCIADEQDENSSTTSENKRKKKARRKSRRRAEELEAENKIKRVSSSSSVSSAVSNDSRLNEKQLFEKLKKRGRKSSLRVFSLASVAPVGEEAEDNPQLSNNNRKLTKVVSDPLAKVFQVRRESILENLKAASDTNVPKHRRASNVEKA